MRYILSCLLMCLLWSAAIAETKTPATRIEQLRYAIGVQLAQQPTNRTLRFRYAQASYQSGHFVDAKHHLRLLMRTATRSGELEQLQNAYKTAVDAAPLSFGVSFSLLPSTNINKISSNEIFDTNLGQFLIAGGGQEESGVGARFGARLGYETILPSNASLTYGLEINRNLYPASRLNTVDGLLSATWAKQSVKGVTRITPYLRRYVYDETANENAAWTRLGVRISREYFLNAESSVTGEFVAERRSYDALDYLNGPAFGAALSYRGKLSNSTDFNMRFGVSTSNPRQEHLRYVSTTLRGEVIRAIPDIGSIGISAGFDIRNYQGIFPALDTARDDQGANIGVSFRLAKVRIFKTSPKVSCQYQVNWSNVALYDYASTDCAIVFERNF